MTKQEIITVTLEDNTIKIIPIEDIKSFFIKKEEKENKENPIQPLTVLMLKDTPSLIIKETPSQIKIQLSNITNEELIEENSKLRQQLEIEHQSIRDIRSYINHYKTLTSPEMKYVLTKEIILEEISKFLPNSK